MLPASRIYMALIGACVRYRTLLGLLIPTVKAKGGPKLPSPSEKSLGSPSSNPHVYRFRVSLLPE